MEKLCDSESSNNNSVSINNSTRIRVIRRLRHHRTTSSLWTTTYAEVLFQCITRSIKVITFVTNSFPYSYMSC
uniref:Uncharacterized protein n=1 Tax=Ascaris lumbricoides TaxID=6252 RepID=A0A0M3HTG2_ASCLU